MKIGVVVFPGSNCDHDAWYAVNHNLGHKADFIWHDSSQLGDVDAVILPYIDNPNGSVRDIAGILNEGRNVAGLMPHPERASDILMGSTDGRVILESMVTSLATVQR